MTGSHSQGRIFLNLLCLTLQDSRAAASLGGWGALSKDYRETISLNHECA